MRETQTLPRYDKFGRERYMLIHKRPVGPKTAERLFSLYEELTKTQEPRTQYMAGWTALEASMVGTHLSGDERARLVDAAQESWEFALQLQREYSAESAWRKNTAPSTIGEYRIATALMSTDVFRELPYGKPSLQTIADMHHKMVDLLALNDQDMRTARLYGNEGRAANHKGLAFELMTMCALNRMYSSKLIATPSFARSDSGLYYPEQTHDVQCVYLKWGEVAEVIPSEVKSRLSGKFLARYVGSGLISGEALTHHGQFSISKQVERFQAEVNGTIEPYDEFMLQDITDTVLHSIRHFKRPELAGIHCTDRRRCEFDSKANSSSAFQVA